MGERYSHLSKAARLKVEALLQARLKVTEIAKIIGVDRSTIYREIKRGQYEGLTKLLEKEKRYSADIAENKYRENLSQKGPSLKIGKDHALAAYIEDRILNDGLSPEAVLGEMKVTGKEKEFTVTICTTTLYSYIDKGIFLYLTNKDLPEKTRRKKKYRRIRRIQKRAAAGDSIEKRPKNVDTRAEFGNWEMDTVRGKQGVTKSCILALTERKTRYEILFLLPDGTTASVVQALDRLENKYRERFPYIFKTITVDNGVEFSDCESMSKSTLHEGERTKMFYCHPYSSFERGSNENLNRMMRRKIPKGTNLDKLTDEDVQGVCGWMNRYPRGILGFNSSESEFLKESDKDYYERAG